MKALLLLVFGVIASLLRADAQSLGPSVISSSGAFFQNGSAMLSSTVGEMTMVETFSAGTSILTQGFQQAYDVGVGIPYQSATHSPQLFPNPTSGNITVVLPEHSGNEITIHVVDAIGKLVFGKSIVMYSPDNRFQLLLNGLVDGMYIVEIRTKTNQYFHKINIIR